MHAFMNLYVPHVRSSLWGPERGIRSPLELEYQVVLRTDMWVLGITPSILQSTSATEPSLQAPTLVFLLLFAFVFLTGPLSGLDLRSCLLASRPQESVCPWSLALG